MKLHSLPDRLDAILQLLQPCAVLADVGTDHGLIPTVALNRGLIERAIATDLRDAPLLHARDTLERDDLEDLVTLKKGDGLKALRGEAVDAVVLAGMGAELMVKLCQDAPDVLAKVTQLLVQPTKDVEVVREWASRNGWHLRDELMVEERGRFHVACALIHGEGPDPAYVREGWTHEALCLAGPKLLERADPVARRFYASQRDRLSMWIGQGGQLQQAQHAVWDAALKPV